MKRMKKTLSVLLSTMLVMVSVCLPLSITASAWEARTNEVDLRLGLLNDTHITKTGSGEALNITALTTLKTLGMEKLAFVGDNVYYTTATDDPSTDREGYNKLWNGLTTAGWEKADVLAFAMGNHEFPQGSQNDATTSAKAIERFETEYGPRNQHVEYKDFHMITGGPETYSNNHSRAMEKYYMEEIDKALCEDSTNETEERITVYDNKTADDTSDDTLAVVYEGGTPNSTKPVFLFLHQPMGNTLSNGSNSLYSAEFKAFLAARPQVIFITAHMHRLGQHPEVICQDAGFTAFQSPMTAGGYQSQWGYTKESEINDSMCSQGSFLEVKDNVVYLYRIDYKNGTYIGEPFVVDIPAIVADRLTEETTDDYNHMPYTTAARNAVTSTAAFPEGATVTAATSGKAVSVTFPNTATMTSYDEVQQDNFIRGYKVEVKLGNSVVGTSEFQADFWKAPANRAASYSKSIGGLMAGTEYTANVYPRMPFGAYGTPISTTFATEAEELDDDSIRYEIEDHCPVTKLNVETEFASGEGLCISAQGGITSGSKVLERTDVTDAEGNQISTFTFDIPVEIPVDGQYGVEMVMGYMASGKYVSKVSMILDKDTSNIVLATNESKGDEYRSPYATYPWEEHIPLYHYTAADQTLTAGAHTVTVSVDLPTATDSEQPFLFAADYIEFIPRTAIIDLTATERIEAEDYISGIVLNEVNDKGTEDTSDDVYQTYSPDVFSSSRASGGKVARFDSSGTDTTSYITIEDYADMTIPIYVAEEGYYEMEYVICQLPDIAIYLDDASGTKLNTKYSRAYDKLKNESGTKYSYFSSTWAYAHIDTVEDVYLPAGNHNIIIRVFKRGVKDIAQYIDYIQFKPATDRLAANGALHYEAEDYYSKFIGNTNKLGNNALASGGKFVYRGSGSAFSFSFLFAVAEAGTYQVEIVAAAGGAMSATTVAIDNGEAKTLTSITNKGTIFTQSYYTLAKRVMSVELTAGLHELIFNVPARTSGGTAYAFDYIHISKAVDEVVTQNDATRIEFEKYTDMDKNTDARIKGVASGDAMVYNNYRTSGDPTIQAEVEIRDSGYYNIEYLVGNRSLYSAPNNVATVNIYLGDKLIGTNDGTHYENLYSQCVKDDAGTIVSGFWYGTSKMCRYIKDAVWLDAGVYTLDADVVSAKSHPAGHMMNYQMDYIEFRPVDAMVELGTNFVTAHINSKDAMNGKAILAVYNGKNLVRTVVEDITNGRYVNLTAVVSDATHAKAFVIDGYDNVKPLVVHQEYTK